MPSLQLHFPTVLIFSAVLMLGVAGALWVSVAPRYRPGERLWIYSLAMLGVGQMSIVLRGLLPRRTEW